MIIDRLDEEFLLFALGGDGHWSKAAAPSLHRGLAAAWLGELMVEGYIRLVDGRVVARTRSPLDDPTLEMVMATLRKPKRPKKARTWIRRLARRAAPHVPVVMERLQGRGHVEVVRSGRTTLYPVHDATARQELRDHLRRVLFGTRGGDDASVALLAILDGAGLTQHVFGPHVAQQADGLFERLLRRDHRFAVLRDNIPRRRRRRRKASARAAMQAWPA